jgi:hypothetical protein
VPAGAVVLEISTGHSEHAATVTHLDLLAGLVYIVVVVVSSQSSSANRLYRAGSGRNDETPSGVLERIATVNGLAALVTLPLLYFASRSTSVTVLADHRVQRYSWLPLWVIALFCLAAICGTVAWWRHRPTVKEPGLVYERAVVTWVVGPVLVFFGVCQLPGALGGFTGFDDSQYLAAPNLIFSDHFFPWRDIYFIHGLLGDVFDGELGQFVFQHSRWGTQASFGLLIFPLCVLVQYAMVAYFARRQPIFPALFVLMIVFHVLPYGVDRFWPLPVLLIALDCFLKRKGRRWAFLLAALLVVEAILTPETGLLALGVLVVVPAFDLAHYRRGAGLGRMFPMTVRLALCGLALTAAWCCFLAWHHSLTAFVEYYRIFATGHASLIVPLQAPMTQLVPYRIWIAAPIVALWLTLWRVTLKLRRRSPWATRDWALLAAALWIALYYQKGIARADLGHFEEVFVVSIPAFVLLGLEALEAADASIARLLFARSQRGEPTLLVHPVALAVCILVVVASAVPVTSFEDIPGRMHVAVPAEPPAEMPRLGYTAATNSVPIGQIEDVQRILATYVPPHGVVFDFTNSFGIYNYLLDYLPGTRFYSVSQAIPEFVQQMLISDLKKSKPRVVIFDDLTFGLPGWDGIINAVRHYDVSAYLLAHYRPVVDSNGTLIMLRDNIPVRPLPGHLVGQTLTSNLYFTDNQCGWGFVPDFLAVPADVKTSLDSSTRLSSAASRNETVSGWAANATATHPAEEVVGVEDGRIVAEARPSAPRPDVASVMKQPNLLYSGYSLDVPAKPGEAFGVYVLGNHRTAQELTLPSSAGGHAHESTASVIRGSGGRLYDVVPGAVGSVDTVTSQTTRSLRRPGSADWASYPWMELTIPASTKTAQVAISDEPDQPLHEITFSTLPGAVRHVFLQVASCPQWYGYGGTRSLYLSVSGARMTPSVSLIRPS